MGVIPQGPTQHCGNRQPHEMHVNEDPGAVHGSHCDGVPPLDPFVELAIRVPMATFMETGLPVDQNEVLGRLCEFGVWPVVELVSRPGSSACVRVRTTDRVDKVYPVVRGVPEGQGMLW